MNHGEAAGSFTFNIEAMFFIECSCHAIDFEDLQSDAFGLLASRRDDSPKQFSSNTVPPVMWMNNDHSYE